MSNKVRNRKRRIELMMKVWDGITDDERNELDKLRKWKEYASMRRDWRAYAELRAEEAWRRQESRTIRDMLASTA